MSRPASPPAPDPGEGAGPVPGVVVAVLALATLAKLALAASTAGTNDVPAWREFAALMTRADAASIYRLHPLYNHPPLVSGALWVLGTLDAALPGAFAFLLRLPAILADGWATFLVHRLVGAWRGPAAAREAALVVAASPVLVMVSGFHGNTDPVMVALVLWAAELAWVRGRPGAAGVALGLSMGVKIVPLICLPLFVGLVGGGAARLAFGAGLAGTLALIFGPPLAVDPGGLLGQCLGYRSQAGIWGMTRLLPQVDGARLDVVLRLAILGILTALAARLAAGVRGSGARAVRGAALTGLGASFLVFLVLAPGFGVQYLAWLAAPAVFLGSGEAAVFQVLGGAFLASVYTYWCGGLPWDLADSNRVGTWQGSSLVLEGLVWAWLATWAWAVLRRVMAEPLPAGEEPAGDRDGEGRGARAALGTALVLGVALRLGGLGTVVHRTPDEVVYARQAEVVAQGGLEGLRALVAEYRRVPRLAELPPPTRAGYLGLLVATGALTGRRGPEAGQLVSIVASLGSLALLAWLALTLLPPWGAAVAVLLYAVSPLELVLARRCWQDALVEAMALGMFAAGVQLARGRPAGPWIAVLVGIGSAGLAVKESLPLVYGLVGLWALGTLGLARREPRAVAGLVAAGLAGAGLTLAALAGAVGGLGSWWAVVSGLPAANAANAYAQRYQTGPGWWLGLGAWCLVPAVTALAAVGLARVGVPAGPEGRALRGLLGVAGVFVLVPFVLPHWLNLRYVAAAYGPGYLLAGLGAAGLAAGLGARVPARARGVAGLLAGALVVMAAAGDARRFARIYALEGWSDLSIGFVVEASRPRRVLPPASRAGAVVGLLDVARGLLVAGQPLAAREVLDRALALEPGSAAARALRELAERELARRRP